MKIELRSDGTLTGTRLRYDGKTISPFLLGIDTSLQSGYGEITLVVRFESAEIQKLLNYDKTGVHYFDE